MVDAIRNLLRSHSIEFKEIHHEPTRISEESAQATYAQVFKTIYGGIKD